MEENDKKETEEEKDLYNWQIEFKGFIEIKGRHKTLPTCYPMLRYLERAIADAVKKTENKFRLYKYGAEVTDYCEDVEFESDD